ncbi:hypothetical protein C4D60_Mb10t21050 [Musa balbisiana]|uniref:Uncharacterized protein n=1 Tax=Musa balbisiana TaxID=52838 RepID=A0A4S8IYP9_MUSBA|nr:hypothetical protein C4D60_Mb10t21050 [Musa balbisiana]
MPRHRTPRHGAPPFTRKQRPSRDRTTEAGYLSYPESRLAGSPNLNQAMSASRPRHEVVDTNILALEEGPECREIGRSIRVNPQLRGRTRSGLPGNTLLRRENLEKSTPSQPQSAIGDYSMTRACRHPKTCLGPSCPQEHLELFVLPFGRLYL